MADPITPERHDPPEPCRDELSFGEHYEDVHVCGMPAGHTVHMLHLCRCGYSWDEESGQAARADASERTPPDDTTPVSELLARAERAEAVVVALPDPSTAEELREKITELLGSTDEALLHAFLDYAWSETARIAGWEMAARWQAEDEAGRVRAELAGASDALCAIGKAALVVAPTLAKPYPEAPETSPWEQFMEHPARRAYELGARIRRELNEERS